MELPKYTIEQYTALKEAIASGARSVYYGDKRVEFASLSEMQQLLENMARELGFITKKKRGYPSYNKGLWS